MLGKVTGGNILFSINSIQKACTPRVWVLNHLVNILKNYQISSKMLQWGERISIFLSQEQ